VVSDPNAGHSALVLSQQAFAWTDQAAVLLEGLMFVQSFLPRQIIRLLPARLERHPLMGDFGEHARARAINPFAFLLIFHDLLALI
jgi:hypothetical protein